MSLPTRECGLKYAWLNKARRYTRHSLRGSVDWNPDYLLDCFAFYVTPYAGVWIEIARYNNFYSRVNSHSLRGSVDWNGFD